MNFLKDTKVRLIPIKKAPNGLVTGTLSEGESTMYTGTQRSISLRLDMRTRKLVDPFRVFFGDQYKEAREFFESKTGRNLDVNTPDNWFTEREHKVKFNKTNRNMDTLYLEFDLQSPTDFLDYMVCSVSNRVTDKEEEKFAGKYEFMLIDQEAKLEKEFDRETLKSELLLALLAKKDNSSWIKNVAKVINLLGGVERYSINTDPRRLFLDLKTDVDKNYNTEYFKRTLFFDGNPKDKTFLTDYALLYDAKQRGVIRTSKGSFLYEGVKVAHSIKDLRGWLNDPENSDLKLVIKKAIQ